jgi:hypothetical protein
MPAGSTGYSLPGVNVQDEGLTLGFGAYLNFTGAGVSVTMSGNVATISIAGGGGGGGTTGWASYYDYAATAGQTTFAASGITTEATKHQVFVNGGLRRIGAQKDYTVSGNNVVFNSGLSLNAVVTIYVA